MKKKNQAEVIKFKDLKCLCTHCQEKGEWGGFCMEHYLWFKAGLLTDEGKKVPHFNQKYSEFIARKAA